MDSCLFNIKFRRYLAAPIVSFRLPPVHSGLQCLKLNSVLCWVITRPRAGALHYLWCSSYYPTCEGCNQLGSRMVHEQPRSGMQMQSILRRIAEKSDNNPHSVQLINVFLTNLTDIIYLTKLQKMAIFAPVPFYSGL